LKSITINKKQVLIHFLIWLAIFILISTQFYSDNRRITQSFFIRVGIDLMLFYINYILLVPFLLLKKKNILYFFSILILLVIVYYLNTFFEPPFNFKPEGIRFKERIGNRGLRSMPVVFASIFLIVSAAIKMYEEWNKNDRNKKEIKAQKNLSELEALKNQINPHFLFNSLNSIYSLTVKKSNDAPEAVITLSELMRYMLYQTNDDFVLLKQELEYLKNYMKLQRLRIANNENVKINIRGTILSQKIRPLFFISFVENAFKYGTDYHGNTEVKIEISVKDNELLFKCINLIGRNNKKEDSSGIGLQNTKERLQLLYPEKHWLIIKEEDNKYIVDLKLKLD